MWGLGRVVAGDLLDGFSVVTYIFNFVCHGVIWHSRGNRHVYFGPNAIVLERWEVATSGGGERPEWDTL